MSKKNKVIYWISTGLLVAMMLMSVGMYFFKHEMVSGVFTSLGYPIYMVYPLAIAKFLGVVAIATRKSAFLKGWAYAGFSFVFMLALSAHLNAKDGGYVPPIVAMILLATSYMFDRKVSAASRVEA
ncbi:MAG: DoxX family protein [Planctomycetota bacterium]|nr:DoxX family protein [Planctomycetota bacterium]